MKSILKTLPSEYELIYGEKFTSDANTAILRQLIPRLIESMKPRFRPTHTQIRNWLAALHKHRRVRLLYKSRDKLDNDNRRIHRNNRLNEVRKPH
jgi:hypothetical protein